MEKHIMWTDEEWASVAKRASALKATKPEVSWMNVALLSQDDIAPERRRFYFNKISALKPLFDILKLDEQGNTPPPPPPPAPEPPPAATTAEPVVKDTKEKLMAEVPADWLVGEMIKRASVFKADLEKLTVLEASVNTTLAEHTAKLDTALKHVDEVEALMLEGMEKMDIINKTYTSMLDNIELVKQRLAAKYPGTEPMDRDFAKAALLLAPPLNPPPHRIIAIRFLLIGPFPKDVQHIKERLPKSANVDLILSENNSNVQMPANINYCLVSGHNDFTRRWQVARETYGAKAFRMENGSIGTYAHKIEALCSQHTAAHTNGGS